MRFYQRSQISVLYAVCGPPVLAPDRERIRPPHIDYLPIVTCRGTATEGRILAACEEIETPYRAVPVEVDEVSAVLSGV